MLFKRKSLECALLLLCCALIAQVALGQRGGNNAGDDDDFDDAGFDDSGYSQPQRETESSNHNPNNYSPSEGEDLDDDDEVDESHMSPQVAEDTAEQPGQEESEPPADQQQPQDQRAELRERQVSRVPFLDNVQTQNFYSPPSAMMVANVHPTTVGLGPFNYNGAHLRYRRSTEPQNKPEGDIEDDAATPEVQTLLTRRKRYAKGGHKSSYIGPVYTYVKTDKHANFKWGVKHKVGTHHG